MTGWGKEPALQGLDLLREAIARDPNYGRALVGAAWCASQLITGGWAENPETDRREALDLVRRAVKAAPDDPEVLVWAAGTRDLVGEDIGPSLAMLDHALTLNPSSAFGWVWSGFLSPTRDSQFFGGPHAKKLVAANSLPPIVRAGHSTFSALPAGL
jgi:adenylate cyclase